MRSYFDDLAVVVQSECCGTVSPNDPVEGSECVRTTFSTVVSHGAESTSARIARIETRPLCSLSVVDGSTSNYTRREQVLLNLF